MKERSFYERACRIHREHPIVDAHLDLAGEIYHRYCMGERSVIRNHYLMHWRKAGIRLIVSSVYVPNRDLPYHGLWAALNQISALYEDIDTIQEEVRLVKSSEEIKQTLADGKIGILLYMEGLDVLTDDVLLLRSFFEMGVRGASLTWSRRNQLGEGCAPADRIEDIPGGLTALGKEALAWLEKRGMFVDISHLNDDGIRDVISLTKKPFIASHSNARRITNNYRNLPDETIRTIAKRGGVIGINAHQKIVGARPGKEGRDKICDHIQYIRNLAGTDCIGIGLDLCDSYNQAAPHQLSEEPGDCLNNHEELILITEELLRRGICEEDVIKIMGGNFIRYFETILD